MNTSQQHHARVKQIFLEACERQGADREAFLAAVDDGLRHEVAELLAEHVVRPTTALTPGTVYASRYRIETLLGRGGMGEVYRAHDNRLDIDIALKRIRGGASASQLAAEVKLAREVTHRSVVRVYDIGEHDGELFFTMELVEGEDLASLLARLGRLPGAKVVDIARQLCGALAAAHARGVLHRDLKPANVMFDRRGEIRLTDFGIAIARGGAGSARIAGSPAYMAPEQLAGEPVTERTDIYALGVVLFELVTGVLPLRGGLAAQRPSELTTDVDPQFERAILHALEKEPSDRPASALALAAELPGVDALAVASEAGITAPAEAVAAARGLRTVSRRTIAAAGAAFGILLAAVVMLSDRALEFDALQLGKAPAVLAERAASLVARTGINVDPSKARTGFIEDPTAASPGDSILFWWRRDFAREEPPFVSRVLRASQQRDSRGPAQSPLKSSLLVVLDGRGEPVSVSIPPEAMKGLRVPLHTAELQRVGPRTDDGGAMWFWRASSSAAKPWRSAEAGQLLQLVLVAILLIVIASIPLALRNVRTGRSDRTSARRIAFAIVILSVAGMFLRGGRVAHPLQESTTEQLTRIVVAMVSAGAVWVAYLGTEPYVRRRWPRTLVGWTRFVRGGVADPLVAYEILIGLTAGAFVCFLETLDHVMFPSPESPLGRLTNAMDLRSLLAAFTDRPVQAVTQSMIFLLLLVILRSTLRREWLSSTVFVLLLATLAATSGGRFAISWFTLGLPFALVVLLLLRQGFLAYLTSVLVASLLTAVPLTTRSDIWYADAGYAVLAALAVMAAITIALSTRAVSQN